MKFILWTLGITSTVLALGLTSIAVAAPTDNAIAVTQWDIAQENLVREFSQGLGVDVRGAQPLLVAKADSAAAGASADRDHRDSERAPQRRTKQVKHSR